MAHDCDRHHVRREAAKGGIASKFLLSPADSCWFLQVRREAAKGGITLYEYVKNGTDPVNVGVLLEDTAAVAGAGVAMSCLGLCMLTGNPV